MIDESKNIPPRKIPDALLSKYTMDGKLNIRYSYQDDHYPVTKPILYTTEMLDSYIKEVSKQIEISYPKTTTFLYKALRKYSITGKSVAILGSRLPAFESICLYYGGQPTTIEYNKIISQDPRLKVMTVAEYNNNPIQFDAAVSISSFEHDGLGRYGDPLNPEGDFEAMRKTKGMIKPGGLLFLAIPVGVDTLVWNAHRVYGRMRLEKLLSDWKILDVFNPWALTLDTDWGNGFGIQPVFVLENTSAQGKNLNVIYYKGMIPRLIIKFRIRVKYLLEIIKNKLKRRLNYN